MGAHSFTAKGKGKTAKEAFQAAVREAQHQYGHGGYTGTIAEKGTYVVIINEPVSMEEAFDLADALIRNGDQRIDDKWGPAGAIALHDNQWLFFGWASS